MVFRSSAPTPSALLARVRHAEQVGGLVGAQLSAGVVGECEEALTFKARRGRKLSRREAERWQTVLFEAAMSAGDLYMRVGRQAPQFGRLLYAAEYFDVAAETASRLGMRASAERARTAGDVCELQFQDGVDRLTGENREMAVLTELRRSLGVGEINRLRDGVGGRLDDGQVVLRGPGRRFNCQRTALAGVAALLGKLFPAADIPHPDDVSSYVNRINPIFSSIFNSPLEHQVRGIAQVERWLADAGDGAIGFLFYGRIGSEVGHFVTVGNHRGIPFVLDPQNNDAYPLRRLSHESGINFTSLVKIAGRGLRELPVDIADLAKEAHDTLNARALAELTPSELQQRAKRWVPEAFKVAVTRLGRDLARGRGCAVSRLEDPFRVAQLLAGGKVDVRETARRLGRGGQRLFPRPDGVGFLAPAGMRPDGSYLALDGDRPVMLATIDGRAVTIDLRSGAAKPGVTINRDLEVLDLSGITLESAQQHLGLSNSWNGPTTPLTFIS